MNNDAPAQTLITPKHQTETTHYYYTLAQSERRDARALSLSVLFQPKNALALLTLTRNLTYYADETSKSSDAR